MLLLILETNNTELSDGKQPAESGHQLPS